MTRDRTAELSRRTETPDLILSCQRRHSRRRQIDVEVLQAHLNRLLADAIPGSENSHPDTRAGIHAALDWALLETGRQ